MNKIKLVFLLLPALLVLGCSRDDTNEPVSTNKTVRYYAYISPSDPNVIKTVSYTNADGTVDLESVAIFQRTFSFSSGSVLNLSATGSTSGVLNIIVRVEIYIDDKLVASQDDDGPGYASASITATVP